MIDSSLLLHLIDPTLPVAAGADGAKPDRCGDRLDYLIEQMSKNGDRLIIPAPVLAEVLVHAGPAGPDWLNTLRGRRAVRVSPFDERAAVECAALARDRAQRQRRTARAKAKFDEQIVAIAAVEGAELILSDDADIRALAPRGITVKGIGDLELPPQDAQPGLFPEEAD